MTSVMPSVAAPARSAAPVTTPADVRSRAIEATLACVARHGLGKTTLDDIAREAGCARATLYRRVGGKRQLVAVTVAAEAERITTELRAVAVERPTLEDAMVAVITTAARELTTHPAIQFLLCFEPELALPHVTFDAGDRFLAHARVALAPCFEPFLPPRVAERGAEWVVRVTLAHAYRADAPVDLSDEAAVGRLVHDFLVPAFLSTTTARG